MVAARDARTRLAIAGGAAALALLAGQGLGKFWLFVLSLSFVYVLASLSLVVLTGWSGQLNLHVAALGLGWGAYAGFALVAHGLPPVWAVLGAGVVTIPFAAAVAVAAVRFRGLELAVATLAMGAICERLLFRNIAKWLGGRAGGASGAFESSFVAMPRPSVFGFGTDGDRAFYYFSLAVAAALFVVVVNVGRASTGRTLRALREREVAAETLGVNVVAYRVGAFVLSIVVASVAGSMFAALKLGIAPDSFDLDLSFRLLAATVIGGIRSPAGALIGGALSAVLPEIVRFGPLQIFSGERLFLVFGIGMIVALWRLPEGLASVLRRRLHARVAVTELPAAGGSALAEVRAERRVYRDALDRFARPTALRVDGVRVRFGGVQALDGVSLSVPEGEICALIGPNGAGKSTLFNCIGGLVTPDEGRIYVRGVDVTDMPPHVRAALGLGRTFQGVELFRDLTVEENLMVAGHRLRTAGVIAEALSLPAAHASERALRARAAEVLDVLGLAHVAADRPAELPLGLLRVLEAGMALVARPAILLLDEPSAGLDPDESAKFAELVSRVRAAYDLTVLLVEHDMAVVGSLAEHVHVLDFGAIIAQGTPAQVRENPVVLERYLGESFEHAAVASGGGR